MFRILRIQAVVKALGQAIGERINFQHINIGDLLREQVMKRTGLA